MIKSIIDKIGTIIEAEFLFGSFLPTLVFTTAVVLSFIWAIGYEEALAWFGTRRLADKSAAPIVATFAVTILAYVLSGIRPLLVQAWSGTVPLFYPFNNLLRRWSIRRYERKRAEASESNPWSKLEDWLQDRAYRAWNQAAARPATAADIAAIRSKLESIGPHLGVDAVRRILKQEFIEKLNNYTGDSLQAIYHPLIVKIRDWKQSESLRLNTLQSDLDANLGTFPTIRGTRLGNIIEGYWQYSYTRYRMEPHSFWPHLQTQMDEDFRKLLANAGTLLDFALTSATLAVVYAALCVFAGPWLFATYLWLIPALGALVAAFFAYQVAIAAARQFGALFRASFDLYRLDLLAALGRPAPATLKEERKRWEELSQLIMYGTVDDFALTPATAKDKT